ncbi:MAG: nuclear transport factor 2 family protein [Oligoflexia bacterium]|nr:nuclear transport factor 2 family protein [Oligoflexia bacterium]
MKHPNAALLEKLYADYSKGDMQAVLNACAEKMTFQVPGKSKLAGKFTKVNFVSGFIEPLKELSGGTLKTEVHDILAGDQHVVVLVSQHVTRKNETVQLRSAHVWRFENAKPVAWYEYPRDLYQFDTTWS